MSNDLTTLFKVNLPDTLNELSAAEINTAIGMDQGDFGLPTLRVNYNDVDDDDNALPRGQWTVYDDNGPVFSPTVVLRVLFMSKQYSHYDADKMELINKSIHFKRWGEEIIDMRGGTKCGKVSRKKLEELSEAEQKMQKSIKLSLVLWGVVSMVGVDRKGEPASIENLPCVFYAKGSNYMPMSTFLDNLDNDRVAIPSVQIALSLDRQKNGSVVYWEAVPKLSDVNIIITADDVVLMKNFSETIRAENTEIEEKWKKARTKQGVGQRALEIDPDMDDPLPDLADVSSDITLS